MGGKHTEMAGNSHVRLKCRRQLGAFIFIEIAIRAIDGCHQNINMPLGQELINAIQAKACVPCEKEPFAVHRKQNPNGVWSAFPMVAGSEFQMEVTNGCHISWLDVSDSIMKHFQPFDLLPAVDGCKEAGAWIIHHLRNRIHVKMVVVGMCGDKTVEFDVHRREEPWLETMESVMPFDTLHAIRKVQIHSKELSVCALNDKTRLSSTKQMRFTKWSAKDACG